MSVTPTPEQQAVIGFPLLPLRVTAGAGTGKTTTMALRLAGLVQGGAVSPEEALGITFTNKAAEELADRLRRSLSGLMESGRQVEVTTYHGFAHSILTEFGPLVGVERGVGVITPGYARHLLREALGTGPRQTLDLTAPGRRVDELVILSGQLGDHLLDPADLETAGIEAGDAVAVARLEMAAVLGHYGAAKRRLGAVDYADMIALCHRLLERHPAVAARIRERYRVVLLDEYQDTNPAQRELLRRIFGEGFPVTAVGDADQTIYEWRGASLENFAAFPLHFPNPDGTPAATLPLSHNRRSANRIVALANLVRGEIGMRSGLDCLRPLQDAPDGEVLVGWFHSAVDEARWIAAEALRLHDGEAVAWRDIGMLFRRHGSIALVRDALERAGVPVEVASLGGLLEVPEVADLHAWLSILGRPDDAPALMRILLGARYRLGLGDLAPPARWLRRRHADVPDDELGGIGWALLEAVDQLEHCDGLSPEAAARLTRFRASYRELLETAQGVSLVELCRRILDRTGAWPEVEALDDAARLSARLNLYRFLDLAEEWSPLEGSPSLDAFLDYLDLLAEERAADELDTARVSGEDAVALLTVHRAKGLEWRVVFLPALCRGTFPSAPHTLEDPSAYPQFLPYERRLDVACLPDLPEDARERRAVLSRRRDDQEWRTAYVAVTRAMERLVCTGAFWYTEKQPKEPGPLLDLARRVEGTQVVADLAEAGAAPATLRFDPVGAEPPDPAFPGGWRDALRESMADPGLPRRLAQERGEARAYQAAVERMQLVLQGLPEPGVLPPAREPFRTSVTGLVTFATCPRRFFWSEIDRLPRRPSAHLRRGIDLHRRIELHNRGTVPFEERHETLYDLAVGEADIVRADPFAAFQASRFAGIRPRLVEAPFELQVGAARVAGRIDAVYEPEPGVWEVVDFKSGSRSDHPAQRVQLEAYSVAAHEAGFAPEPPRRMRVAFVYLGGGGAEEVAEEADGPWLEEARHHLHRLVGAASGGDYPPTPSHACEHCDFARFCPEGTAWLRR